MKPEPQVFFLGLKTCVYTTWFLSCFQAITGLRQSYIGRLCQHDRSSLILLFVYSWLFDYLRQNKNCIRLKAMLHGAIFLATCNAILLLRDVKLPNTSLHYTPLMFSQHHGSTTWVAHQQHGSLVIINNMGRSKKKCVICFYNKKNPIWSTFSLSNFADMMSLGELQIRFPLFFIPKIHLMTSYLERWQWQSWWRWDFFL
jgi:hypothetical protein